MSEPPARSRPHRDLVIGRRARPPDAALTRCETRSFTYTQLFEHPIEPIFIAEPNPENGTSP